MIKRLTFLLLIISGFGHVAMAQQLDTVVVTLENPYNTVLSHLYYLQEENYQPEIAAQTLYNVSDPARAQRLAIKLKQIFDGEGLYVQVRRSHRIRIIVRIRSAGRIIIRSFLSSCRRYMSKKLTAAGIILPKRLLRSLSFIKKYIPLAPTCYSTYYPNLGIRRCLAWRCGNTWGY
jgi:hypothetical protein